MNLVIAPKYTMAQYTDYIKATSLPPLKAVYRMPIS